ncbi:ankyrin repeat-containing domain protein [Mycena leptocephala]|nr:ankyrin repeat-containing domain protein [Mycena leptocephala]
MLIMLKPIPKNWAICRGAEQIQLHINALNNADETALHAAALNRKANVVLLLLENGADVNARDKYNNTALHRAVSYGYEDVARLLLEHGADEAIIMTFQFHSIGLKSTTEIAKSNVSFATSAPGLKLNIKSTYHRYAYGYLWSRLEAGGIASQQAAAGGHWNQVIGGHHGLRRRVTNWINIEKLIKATTGSKFQSALGEVANRYGSHGPSIILQNSWVP